MTLFAGYTVKHYSSAASQFGEFGALVEILLHLHLAFLG